MGASAPDSEGIADELAACAQQGRACFFWCDGADATAVLGDKGDCVSDVVRLVSRVLPEFGA